ncbi:MAG: membrane protein insertion efficiency factor YidD [Candidatus Eisenbacteria bacterium]|nr:membrane protein insertion efficiency factor YidD [Candidatus Eisenbacteria bacterium]
MGGVRVESRRRKLPAGLRGNRPAILKTCIAGPGRAIGLGPSTRDALPRGPIAFLLAGAAALLSISAPAASVFDWGWDRSRPGGAEVLENHFRFPAPSLGTPSFSDKLIKAYREHVSPKQGPRCPCLPSCSVYTQYAIREYGFFRGFVMAIERMYIRENLDMTSRAHYMSLINAKGEIKLYDPPEANDIFTHYDWRVIHPRYDLYRIEHQRDRCQSRDRDGPAGPRRYTPGERR